MCQYIYLPPDLVPSATSAQREGVVSAEDLECAKRNEPFIGNSSLKLAKLSLCLAN
jgi:hypothetical protein